MPATDKPARPADPPVVAVVMEFRINTGETRTHLAHSDGTNTLVGPPADRDDDAQADRLAAQHRVPVDVVPVAEFSALPAARIHLDADLPPGVDATTR